MKRITGMLVCLALFSYSLFAQDIQITGKVTSEDDGSALPGVAIVVKGTTIGMATDENGTYSIKAPSDAVLVFTSVGMTGQEVEVNGRTVINVALLTEVTGLDEVVLVAYGTKRAKKEITYQTQQVSENDLVTVAPIRAASALAGKVAGLQINLQDNGVNPSSQILLRGMRSISGNNEALIVIDGSISSQGAFNDLNPNDIESINILKGATAAALYGSNAGNGAFIVTTKKGRLSQKLTVGINSSYTIEQVAYMPDFQTEYGTGWEGAYDPVENTNWGPRFDGTLRQIGPTFPDDYPLETQIVPYAPVKNNLRDFFVNGNTLSNTVYLQGGNETSTFYLSVGDQRSTGIVIDDEYQRNTVKANATKKVGKVELFANTLFLKDRTDIVGNTIGDQDRPLYWFLLNTSANIPLSEYSDWDNPEGYGYADNYYNAYYQNPYWAVGTNRNIDYTNRFVGNVGLSYDILKWVNFTTRIGVNNTWGHGKNWRASQAYDEVLQPAHSYVSSFIEDSEFQDERYTMDAMLTGNYNFTDLSVKLLLGGSNYIYSRRWSQVRANNLSIPDFYDISNGTGQLVGLVDESAKRTFGYFGELTFGYKDFVYLNLSGRNDWTSTLAKGNNSYFYPSVGISFVPTDAISSLKNNDVLSTAKITLSNSTVYNDLEPYQINETYLQSTYFPFGTINGFYLSETAVDANISKEKLNTTEIGLNTEFLKRRIWFDAAYYFTKTTDLITETTPSVASGSEEFLTNIGELQGRGLELTLGGSIISTPDFSWKVMANYTNQETVVKEIKEGLDEISIWTHTNGQYGVYAVVDEVYPQIKANDYYTDPEGHIVIDPSSGNPIEKTGLFSLGTTLPKHIVGLTTIIALKGFSISATADYRTGHVYYEQGSDQMEFTGRSIESVSSNRQDFVVPNSVIEVSEGVFEPNTNIPVSGGRQSYWTDTYNNVKSNYIKDATALKIREFRVDYTLPSKWLQNLKIQKIQVGFIARNLMTWLPEENRFSDPEFNNTNQNADLNDFDTNPYTVNSVGIGGYLQGPPTRSFGFNINLEF